MECGNKEYRGFKYTEEFVNDMKNILDIDIKDLIDNYLDKSISNLNITVDYKVYDINIEDNNVKVTVELKRVWNEIRNKI